MQNSLKKLFTGPSFWQAPEAAPAAFGGRLFFCATKGAPRVQCFNSSCQRVLIPVISTLSQCNDRIHPCRGACPQRSYLDQGGTTPLLRAYAIDCPRCSC